MWLVFIFSGCFAFSSTLIINNETSWPNHDPFRLLCIKNLIFFGRQLFPRQRTKCFGRMCAPPCVCECESICNVNVQFRFKLTLLSFPLFALVFRMRQNRALPGNAGHKILQLFTLNPCLRTLLCLTSIVRLCIAFSSFNFFFGSGLVWFFGALFSQLIPML